jgi:hypothetical protein
MLPAPRAAVSRVFEPRLCEIGRLRDQIALRQIGRRGDQTGLSQN